MCQGYLSCCADFYLALEDATAMCGEDLLGPRVGRSRYLSRFLMSCMVTLITLPILYLAVDRDRQASVLLERVTRDSSLKTWLRVFGLERMGRDCENSVYSVYYVYRQIISHPRHY
jgi:hypothetical protein